MNDLVSIIVPTYNAGRFVQTTIDSLLAQTHRNIEILVVDDQSTDDTQDIVRSYGGAVRLISQRNAGVCKARNHGAREARGTFVCFCDHDDYWYPEKVEQQVAAFAADPGYGVVYTRFIFWNEDAAGNFQPPAEVDRNADAQGLDAQQSGWIYHQLLIDCWVLTSSAMIRADVLEQCGGFNEDLPYGEDWELWLRISRKYRFARLDRALVLYRQHRNQGSRVVRDIDYRTKILSEAVARWGLTSPNGQGITRREFNRNIGRYHVAYGLNRLRTRHVVRSWGSFFHGWLAEPANAKPIVYVVLSCFGWRPRWD